MPYYYKDNEEKFFKDDKQVPEGFILGYKERKFTCPRCGKEYYAHARSRKACFECSNIKDKVCKYCGKSFTTTNNTDYCSDTCKAKAFKIAMNNPERCKKMSEIKKKTGKQWAEKLQKTLLKNTGYEHALQNPESKKKLEETIEKSGKSGRFGTKEHNDAMIKKYGAIVPYKINSIKEKGIATLKRRYGEQYASPAQLPDYNEKSKATCLKKYGVEYSFQSENNKNKSKQTMLERYGVENPSQLPNRKYSKKSKLNEQIGFLLNLNSDDFYEVPIESKSFDLKKDDILIEINPSVTHNIDKNIIFNSESKITKTYHQNKTLLANKYGYRCIHIWDWDDLDKIVLMLNSTPIVIYGRKCSIIEVDNTIANNFYNTWHLQGGVSGNNINIGLVYNDTLISMMTFGDSRYSKKYPIELLRYCTDFNYKIIGGAKKLFNYFVNTYHPESIVSYCDNSKFTGKVYLELGFKLISYGKPSCHWCGRHGEHFTDNLLRQLGADKLIGTTYGKNTNNEDIMLNNNFVRVYDCGQSTYVWINEAKIS